jgi:sugar phosphate isomerase/epimerase
MLDYKEDQKQPSYDAFRNHFGSWANAVRKAGIEPNYMYFSDQEILDEIKRCLDKANTKYLTMEEYQQLSNYPHPKTAYKRFGSWKKAVELAKRREENSNKC